MRAVALVALLAACEGERRAAAPRPDASRAVDARRIDAAIVPDARPAPSTLDEALAALRASELEACADVIARRVAQRSRKMRLGDTQAMAAAIAVGELAAHESIRVLAGVMPRSTVELARAVRERGVPEDEAVRIAAYLAEVARVLDFQRPHVFDDNHSHVIGREWHEIDYSGEGMTWQGQRDHWAPRGVKSFERAAYIHAYFVGAEPLEHWDRVYRPRGKMAGVTAPPP